MPKGQYYIPFSLKKQAVFTFVAVFRESIQYVRDYTLPFNMIGITSRCKDENSSVVTNLHTGEETHSHLNDVHLIPSGLPQRYRHTLDQEHLSIHFKLELYPGVDVFSNQPVMYLFNSEIVRREAEEIFAVSDSIRMLSRCQELALRICHKFWPETYPFDLARMSAFDDVLHYIRESSTAQTTVEELAGLKHCAVGTFTREFHDVFQMPPKLFLQKELYRKATQLLLMPGASVKTVASQMQFSSEFYFSRFFKRMCGIPPKDFRKIGRK